MVSLWGSKKNGEQQQPEEEDQDQRAASSHSQPSRPSDEANERTRLLPRHEHGVGYLSPDDPAVSSSLSGIATS